MNRVARGIALLASLFLVGFGVWAFVDPRSFFDQVATYRPYNEHFLHDVGAFQIGIGAALLLALRWKDALAVALGGAAAGGILHAVSHFMDRELGGKDTDPWFLSFLAAVIVIGLVARRPTRSS
ncbi:MAG: hypothetical protein ACRDKS_18025 [Actinomycetota bacterium]